MPKLRHGKFGRYKLNWCNVLTATTRFSAAQPRQTRGAARGCVPSEAMQQLPKAQGPPPQGLHRSAKQANCTHAHTPVWYVHTIQVGRCSGFQWHKHGGMQEHNVAAAQADADFLVL
mgnify:CR=1 FL=1